MTRVLQGMRLLWSDIEPRKRLMIRTIFLAWLNVAWVSSLGTYSQIAQTRRAYLVDAWGVLASTVAFYIWARLRLFPLIRQDQEEWERDRAANQAARLMPPLDVPPAVRRGGFGHRGSR